MSNKSYPSHGYIAPMAQSAAVLGISGTQQAVSESLPDKLKRVLRINKHRGDQVKALEEVISFFEAQINIDPFGSDEIAHHYYQLAMDAAIESLRKLAS